MNHGDSFRRRGQAPYRRIDWSSRALVAPEPPPELPVEARRLVVARGARWESVDLRRLYSTMRDGAPCVSLLDVWVASGIRGDLFEHSFDFLDANGRPASRRGEPRLESAIFAAGWMTMGTHDLLWPGPEVPAAHWHVKGVTAIVAVKAGARRRKRMLRTYVAPRAQPCRLCGR